jgi:hypothetical protein
MILTINAKIFEGQPVLDSTNTELLKLFIKSLPEGSNIEVTYEIVTHDKTYAQLSKVHKCIRDLATFTGHTFDEMKKLVKDEAGLVTIDGKYRSFAICSKEEISHAIQTAISIGERIGCSLY